MDRDLTPDVREPNRDPDNAREARGDRLPQHLSVDRFPERNPERILTERQRDALQDMAVFGPSPPKIFPTTGIAAIRL